MEISLYPAEREKKYIKRRYARTAFTIMISVIIFQGVPLLLLSAVGLANGASFSECLKKGSEILHGNGDILTLVSIGFPIIADIAAIIIGSKLLGINFKDKKLWSREGTSLKDISCAACAAFFLQTASALLCVIIYLLATGDSTKASSNVLPMSGGFAVSVFMYFYVCIFGPVMEEMIFRGLVLESIRPYNEKFAVFFSALVFGLMHGNMPQFLNGFLAGLVLGIMYARTRSLLTSVVIHIISNTLNSLFAVMIYSRADILDRLIEGDLGALQGLPMAGIALNMIIRVFTFFAGIAVIASTAGSGFGLRRPKPEGKTRAAPLVFSTAMWILVLIVYVVIMIKNF